MKPLKRIALALVFLIVLSENGYSAVAEDKKQTTMEKVEQASQATKEAAKRCVNSGTCMPDMFFCVANLLCFNNCELGHDPEAVSKSSMIAVLGFFGLGDIPVEGNSVIGCRQNCVSRSISDCNDTIPDCKPEDSPKCLKPKEQPPLYFDYQRVPATADPARICREYCGAIPDWPGAEQNQWCENRCKALDPLSDCIKRNKGVPDVLQTCGYDGKNIGGSDATWNKDSLVAIKMNSFVQEAACVYDQEAGRPDSNTCKYLCQDQAGVAKEQAAWLRTCKKMTDAEIEAALIRQKEVDLAMKRAVGVAMEAANAGFVAVKTAERVQNKLQKETSENVAEYEKRQKEEQEQAERELAAEQK